SSAPPTHQTVIVGQTGIRFYPETITASPGSRISFSFEEFFHSVAQSSLSNPCNPLSASSPFSGAISGGEGRVWTVTVPDTNPMYFYCSVGSHCQEGMVMVVNPPSSGGGTLEGYRAAAEMAGSKSAPAQAQGGSFVAFMTTTDGTCGG
ncbi:hypothetical protein EJ08DRAFT_573903, partial [Tothia fuscella]